MTNTGIDISDTELQILNESIFNLYGYDFSGYSFSSYKRRVLRVISNLSLPTFTQLLDKIKTDPIFFNLFLEEITVNVTEMFRDVNFYKCLRRNVIPQLSTYSTIRIWHAGCSSGEEVYSLAILLKEANLLSRSLLYATDINQEVLSKAKAGAYSLELINQYSENYKKSGGLFELSDYYTIKNNKAFFNEEFSKRMVFSPHNLILDKSFNEFNLILCRNVLIYFDRETQNKVVKLFFNSLSSLGYLALGAQETLDFNDYSKEFELIEKNQKIWRMKK